jgi:hypothetical protein
MKLHNHENSFTDSKASKEREIGHRHDDETSPSIFTSIATQHRTPAENGEEKQKLKRPSVL